MWGRFFAAYRLELHQILRQWSYWLIQVLLLAYIVSTFGRYSTFTAQELLWAGAGRNMIGVGCLIALVLGAFSAGRAHRNRMLMLEEALPVGAEIPLARSAALITTLLPFFLSGIAVAVQTGPMESFWRGLPVFILESALTFAFTALLVWVIYALFGIRRWIFPLLVLLWVAAIMTITLIGVPVIGPWMSVWNFTRFGYSGYSAVWERLPQGDFPWLLNWFYLGLSVLLLGLLVHRVEVRRFYRSTRIARGLLGVGLVVAVIAYLTYVTGFSRALVGVNTPWRSESASPETVFYMPPAFEVTRYDVALDVGGVPAFAVMMDVVNRGDAPLSALEFSLVDTVEIQRASVDFSRDGALLTLIPDAPLAAGETLTVALEYAGQVAKYRYVWGAPPELETFVTADGILLDYKANWYPRVGRDASYRYADAASDFRVRVTGTALPLISNLPGVGDDVFAASEVSWVTVFGSPNLGTFHPVEGVSVVMSTAQYQKMNLWLKSSFAQTHPVVGRYFPEGYTLILLQERWGSGSFIEFYTTGIHNVVQLKLGERALEPVLENISQFIWLQIRYGNADAMRRGHEDDNDLKSLRFRQWINAPPDVITARPGYPDDYAVTEKLIDVYEKHGAEGIAALIDAIRSGAGGPNLMQMASAAAWIESWAAENLPTGGEE